MPGLNLRSGVSANASGVVFAQAPSVSGTTITQQAYGISSGAEMMGSKCAGWGVCAAGIAATAILGYLYYSLPR